jgi:RNA-binding protein
MGAFCEPCKVPLPYTGSMILSPNHRKYLRGLGHALHPVVLIGQHGLTEAVVKETTAALESHELLKVRARLGDRLERQRILSTLAERTESELVQTIGNVGLFYKKNKESGKIIIPDY